jgi:D-alanyl-lipoteichoic acid acyltransferase DltB (MBOAT superfamily)
MFGILLPLNFNSPYKATSIIEFWERWHMTLARFLRDYVYIALGSLRASLPRRRANLFLTMLLCGLWHGAGWTFVCWGALQGALLLVNHGWRDVKRRYGLPATGPAWRRGAARVAAFAAVTATMTVFRAPDLDSALTLLSSMAGLGGFGLEGMEHFAGPTELSVIAAVWLLVWALPNTQEFLSEQRPAIDWQRWEGRVAPALLFGAARWRPSFGYSALIAVLAATALTLAAEERAFVYFQF